MEKGIKKAEHFFNINKNTIFNYVHDFTYDKIYNSYADEVLNYWNMSLREKLEKYARAVLYNPDGMNY